MCGLLSGSGKIKPEIIAALGCLNSSRGRDSAGIAWAEGGKIRLKKRAADPLVVFNVDLKAEIAKAVDAGNVIGHTRQATHGTVNSDNAHPFFMEGIAFAHNGVIQNYLDFGQYEVDSQALIHGIIKKDFSEYRGNIALLWLEGGKIHAFRKGNPLFRGVIGNALYLSSEEDDLKAVGCQKTRELSEGHIYTIDKGAIIGSKKTPTFTAPVTTYGRVHSHARWENGKWTDDNRVEPPPPPFTATCECGHTGEFHEHIHSHTNNWACYAKKDISNPLSTICSCNAWKQKDAPKQIETVATVPAKFRSMCVCNHGLMRHSLRNTQQSCDVTSCPCGNFRQQQRPDAEQLELRRAELWNMGLENMPVQTPCECNHELEYHREGLHCQVSMCTCKWFYPSECVDVIESNFR